MWVGGKALRTEATSKTVKQNMSGNMPSSVSNSNSYAQLFYVMLEKDRHVIKLGNNYVGITSNDNTYFVFILEKVKSMKGNAKVIFIKCRLKV